MTEATSPLLRQYHGIKQRYPQALLLFRLGDFYELFYEDAIAASRELQITLTSRNREAGQPVPMCGVPYHAAENYIARLIRAGYKVAICEQMEEPSRKKKLVHREVIRVITPGTATDFPLLEPRENNYLAAVAREIDAGIVGLAAVDVSTGEFTATEFSGPDAETRLREELELLRAREVLLPRPTTLFSPGRDGQIQNAVETRLDDWVFRPDYGARLLSEQF
ncbi:MAG: DNA mismatch repair protein MutS, partial [Acidobacteriota bacterium]|nr:DNA mismatch repair protein MutS [Acidobacteriota bacterium]